ncbi:hypothetical protein GCM10028807_48900 [Spirosoma daeguense]
MGDTTRFLPIGRQLGVLEDKTAQLTFEQVRRRTDFVPSRSETFQYGYSSSAFWFRFQVTNHSRENIKHWLIGLLDASSVEYADCYVVYADGRVEHQTGGLKRPYVDRGFFATTPFFRIKLPTNEPVTVFFRIESSVTMFGKVTIWEEYYNLSKGRVIIFAIWMFLGLFILRSLNSFVLARFVPNRQFRFYTVCTFLLYLATLARTGIYPILLANHPQLLDWIHTGMGRLMPLGLAVWMYTLLDNRPVLRPMRWLLLAIAGTSFIGVFLSFFVQNAAIGQFFAILVLLTYILFFVGAGIIWRIGQRSALVFVVPIAICTIPFSLYQLQSLAIIAYHPAISHLALLALALEMVLMSLVLGRIVQSYIKERVTAANALMQEKVEVDKLQELDVLKTQFFTNISHEFRTPLTLILAPIAELKERYPTENVLTLMERNGKRLLTLINQLLDLSKLEAGQLKAESEPGDIAVFFRTLASSFSSLAQSRRINFTFDQLETGWWTLYDRDKLEKIITNLLSNAFKFTPEGNDVRMTIRYLNEHQVLVTVQDTGIGISETDLAHIFERFYQRSDTTADGQMNRAYEGTGIGLALVHELVRVLGGTIDVTSQEGLGTTFTVSLPLMPVVGLPDVAMSTDNDLARQEKPEQLVGINTNQERQHAELQPADVASDDMLLIIDDNADIRAYVRSIFEADYQIVEAIDGQDGLEKATSLLPNVVICDLMMPRLSGFDFCRMLKNQSATSHIPVVMLTAKATTEDRIEGFGLGADDYLTKPFNRAELLSRVRNLLQQRKRLYSWFGRRPDVADVTLETTPALAILTSEQLFIDRLTRIVHERLSESTFTVEGLAEAVNLSRSQLHRKLKTLLDMSPTNFIRDIRLAKAAQLLTEGEQNVTQIAYAVGFDSLSYFSKTFQERYGVLPSAYGRASSSLS